MSIDSFFDSNKINVGNKYIQSIKQKAKKSDSLTNLIKVIVGKGFHFGGDTPNPPEGSGGTKSKAFTDPQNKTICIGLNTTVDEAVLSLSYELINAENAEKFKAINRKFLIDDEPTDQKATRYAKSILKVEAEAVYQRSKIALEENIPNLIKNQKYIQFVKEESDPEVAKKKIFEEMVKNGRVHGGAKSAMSHYEEIYHDCITPDVD